MISSINFGHAFTFLLIEQIYLLAIIIIELAIILGKKFDISTWYRLTTESMFTILSILVLYFMRANYWLFQKRRKFKKNFIFPSPSLEAFKFSVILKVLKVIGKVSLPLISKKPPIYRLNNKHLKMSLIASSS